MNRGKTVFYSAMPKREHERLMGVAQGLSI